MTTQESLQKDQVRILVVDDHPNTAAMLARALTQLGPVVNVISATSGHDALEKAKANRTVFAQRGGRYDGRKRARADRPSGGPAHEFTA